MTTSPRKTPERALLAARVSGNGHGESLRELARLAETAGAVVVGTVLQEREGIDPATYLGSGKVAEVAACVQQNDVQLVCFDHELSPSQNRNLEDRLQVKVLDRTSLILDIFAQHATTREGKLQVELAQLKYLLPRLVGQVRHWSRLPGGIGTSGPGETLLEMERRRLRARVTHVEQELHRVESQRDLQRKQRQRVPVPLVSLVGYTNAGKSSLMNRLTSAGVLVQDALFATLDPTVRRVRLPSGRQFLLADTVGFVRKLPPQLIEAFKATLREIDNASLLLHVIDSPQPDLREQIQTVEQVLAELHLDHKPVLRVFNKMDQQPTLPAMLEADGVPSVRVSARTGAGLESLLAAIAAQLTRDATRVTLALPYAAGDVVHEIYRSCRVLHKEDNGQGIRLTAELGPKFLGKFAAYIER